VDTQREEDSSQRASVFTNNTSDAGEDGRRKSIRVEVDGLPNNVMPLEGEKGKRVEVEVVRRPMSPFARGHSKGRESKSECRVM
jgi:hypothetical protein